MCRAVYYIGADVSGEAYCIHFQGRRLRQQVHLERWYLFIYQTIQRQLPGDRPSIILTSVKTPNPK